MEHTKEPWDTDGFSSVGATGSDQFNDGYFTAICEGPDKVANARRISACVNVCQGSPIEALEEMMARRLTLGQLAFLHHQATNLFSAFVRDAKRYRWLRSRDLETIDNGGVFAELVPQNVVLNEDDLDAAIDAEIAKSEATNV